MPYLSHPPDIFDSYVGNSSLCLYSFYPDGHAAWIVLFEQETIFGVQQAHRPDVCYEVVLPNSSQPQAFITRKFQCNGAYRVHFLLDVLNEYEQQTAKKNSSKQNTMYSLSIDLNNSIESQSKKKQKSVFKRASPQSGGVRFFSPDSSLIRLWLGAIPIAQKLNVATNSYVNEIQITSENISGTQNTPNNMNNTPAGNTTQNQTPGMNEYNNCQKYMQTLKGCFYETQGAAWFFIPIGINGNETMVISIPSCDSNTLFIGYVMDPEALKFSGIVLNNSQQAESNTIPQNEITRFVHPSSYVNQFVKLVELAKKENEANKTQKLETLLVNVDNSSYSNYSQSKSAPLKSKKRNSQGEIIISTNLLTEIQEKNISTFFQQFSEPSLVITAMYLPIKRCSNNSQEIELTSASVPEIKRLLLSRKMVDHTYEGLHEKVRKFRIENFNGFLKGKCAIGGALTIDFAQRKMRNYLISTKKMMQDLNILEEERKKTEEALKICFEFDREARKSEEYSQSLSASCSNNINSLNEINDSINTQDSQGKQKNIYNENNINQEISDNKNVEISSVLKHNHKNNTKGKYNKRKYFKQLPKLKKQQQEKLLISLINTLSSMTYNTRSLISDKIKKKAKDVSTKYEEKCTKDRLHEEQKKLKQSARIIGQPSTLNIAKNAKASLDNNDLFTKVIGTKIEEEQKEEILLNNGTNISPIDDTVSELTEALSVLPVLKKNKQKHHKKKHHKSKKHHKHSHNGKHHRHKHRHHKHNHRSKSRSKGTKRRSNSAQNSSSTILLLNGDNQNIGNLKYSQHSSSSSSSPTSSSSTSSSSSESYYSYSTTSSSSSSSSSETKTSSDESSVNADDLFTDYRKHRINLLEEATKPKDEDMDNGNRLENEEYIQTNTVLQIKDIFESFSSIISSSSSSSSSSDSSDNEKNMGIVQEHHLLSSFIDRHSIVSSSSSTSSTSSSTSSSSSSSTSSTSSDSSDSDEGKKHHKNHHKHKKGKHIGEIEKNFISKKHKSNIHKYIHQYGKKWQSTKSELNQVFLNTSSLFSNQTEPITKLYTEENLVFLHEDQGDNEEDSYGNEESINAEEEEHIPIEEKEKNALIARQNETGVTSKKITLVGAVDKEIEQKLFRIAIEEQQIKKKEKNQKKNDISKTVEDESSQVNNEKKSDKLVDMYKKNNNIKKNKLLNRITRNSSISNRDVKNLSLIDISDVRHRRSSSSSSSSSSSYSNSSNSSSSNSNSECSDSSTSDSSRSSSKRSNSSNSSSSSSSSSSDSDIIFDESNVDGIITQVSSSTYFTQTSETEARSIIGNDISMIYDKAQKTFLDLSITSYKSPDIKSDNSSPQQTMYETMIKRNKSRCIPALSRHHFRITKMINTLLSNQTKLTMTESRIKKCLANDFAILNELFIFEKYLAECRESLCISRGRSIYINLCSQHNVEEKEEKGPETSSLSVSTGNSAESLLESVSYNSLLTVPSKKFSIVDTLFDAPKLINEIEDVHAVTTSPLTLYLNPSIARPYNHCFNFDVFSIPFALTNSFANNALSDIFHDILIKVRSERLTDRNRKFWFKKSIIINKFSTDLGKQFNNNNIKTSSDIFITNCFEKENKMNMMYRYELPSMCPSYLTRISSIQDTKVPSVVVPKNLKDYLSEHLINMKVFGVPFFTEDSFLQNYCDSNIKSSKLIQTSLNSTKNAIAEVCNTIKKKKGEEGKMLKKGKNSPFHIPDSTYNVLRQSYQNANKCSPMPGMIDIVNSDIYSVSTNVVSNENDTTPDKKNIIYFNNGNYKDFNSYYNSSIIIHRLEKFFSSYDGGIDTVQSFNTNIQEKYMNQDTFTGNLNDLEITNKFTLSSAISQIEKFFKAQPSLLSSRVVACDLPDTDVLSLSYVFAQMYATTDLESLQKRTKKSKDKKRHVALTIASNDINYPIEEFNYNNGTSIHRIGNKVIAFLFKSVNSEFSLFDNISTEGKSKKRNSLDIKRDNTNVICQHLYQGPNTRILLNAIVSDGYVYDQTHIAKQKKNHTRLSIDSNLQNSIVYTSNNIEISSKNNDMVALAKILSNIGEPSNLLAQRYKPLVLSNHQFSSNIFTTIAKDDTSNATNDSHSSTVNPLKSIMQIGIVSPTTLPTASISARPDRAFFAYNPADNSLNTLKKITGTSQAVLVNEAYRDSFVLGVSFKGEEPELADNIAILVRAKAINAVVSSVSDNILLVITGAINTGKTTYASALPPPYVSQDDFFMVERVQKFLNGNYEHPFAINHTECAEEVAQARRFSASQGNLYSLFEGFLAVYLTPLLSAEESALILHMKAHPQIIHMRKFGKNYLEILNEQSPSSGTGSTYQSKTSSKVNSRSGSRSKTANGSDTEQTKHEITSQLMSKHERRKEERNVFINQTWPCWVWYAEKVLGTAEKHMKIVEVDASEESIKNTFKKLLKVIREYQKIH